MSSVLRLISTLSLFCLTPLLAHADEALQARINTVLNAHGGEEVWANTQAIEYFGDTFSQSRHAMGTTQRSFQYPDKFRISIEYPGNETELRQLNGDQVWDHNKPGSEPFALATQLQAMRMMAPKLLLENRQIAEDLGTRKDEEGVLHHGIGLQIGDLKIVIASDAETGYILATWGTIEMMGQTMQFVTFYHDYRVVEGRAIAFKEEHYAMGSYTGHTEIAEVKFPASLPEKLFQPE